MLFENENIEFKSQATDDIYKEVVAFANSQGGEIFIGYDDKGRNVGIENMDSTYTRITNGIRDAIQPDVTLFTKYQSENNSLIRITVSEGSSKPYFLKSKGLKPGGVYVRQGASSVQASFEQIRQMIKNSDGDIFEEMRCPSQMLTFEQAERAFKKYGVEFGSEKYRALGITESTNSLFTNLALLLSDQCPYTVKVAVFGDEANTEFRDSKEFGGSVFNQLEGAFSYLMLCNGNASVFKGLERIDRPDYPQEALREALLNAIVHRDYGFSGSVIINVNSKRAEFISIGGLLPGLSEADIKAGISQPRNKNLAEIFHRLRLIEAYGTGIRRIFTLYAENQAQPDIEVTPNTFKLILPNMNTATTVSPDTTSTKLTEQQRKILSFIESNGKITDSEIEKLLNIKSTRRYTLVKQLISQGLLTVKGKGLTKAYTL